MSRRKDNETAASRKRVQTFKQEVEGHLKGKPPLLVLLELYYDGLTFFFLPSEVENCSLVKSNMAALRRLEDISAFARRC